MSSITYHTGASCTTIWWAANKCHLRKLWEGTSNLMGQDTKRLLRSSINPRVHKFTFSIYSVQFRVKINKTCSSTSENPYELSSTQHQLSHLIIFSVVKPQINFKPLSPQSDRTYPSGWCKIPTRSSTAMADAMGASPGRVTVHCWSNVRLAVDCKKNM